MKRRNWIVLVAALSLAGRAFADDELLKLQKDDKQWVMAGKKYSANRLSSLNQGTTVNVKQLKEAGAFSTRGLRGHEGGAPVVGGAMDGHLALTDTEASAGSPHHAP